MKLLKKITIILLMAFVGIQFIPTIRNQSVLILQTDFNNTFEVPNNIQRILKISCYDCHSNNTNYPWYNKIQPASWLLEKHIKEGKKELNFSEFGTYSKRRQKSKLKAVINQIRDDEMPLYSYALIHGETILSERNKKYLIDWLSKQKDGIQK
ncbi:heme-binding domain-containing protein [Lutibacter sp.]|uniref:heme-binding domain-containing protein n=1 Tax=Lutibacter sp. TaxID=1925666 RepID=UPI003565CCA5